MLNTRAATLDHESRESICNYYVCTLAHVFHHYWDWDLQNTFSNFWTWSVEHMSHHYSTCTPELAYEAHIFHYWTGSLAVITPILSVISIASLSITEPTCTACIHQNYWVHSLQHVPHNYAVALWIMFLTATVSHTMILSLQLMSWLSGAHEQSLLSASSCACIWPLKNHAVGMLLLLNLQSGACALQLVCLWP